VTGRSSARRRATLAIAILLACLWSAVVPATARAETAEVGEVEVDAGVDWPAGTDADSPAEGGVRKVWDVLFWRPIYVVQLVGGVVVLPLALPLAELVGDWRDGVDMCVTGPAQMAFARPLGQ
jgi:hypothetical protein